MTFKEYQEWVKGNSSPGGYNGAVRDAMAMTVFAGFVLDETESFVMAGRIDRLIWMQLLGSILWYTGVMACRAEVKLRPDWPRIVTRSRSGASLNTSGWSDAPGDWFGR